MGGDPEAGRFQATKCMQAAGGMDTALPQRGPRGSRQGPLSLPGWGPALGKESLHWLLKEKDKHPK